MTSTTKRTNSTPVRFSNAGSGLKRLRRALAGPKQPKVPTTTQGPTRPVIRRVWREVAPGEWRWLHVDDHAAPT
jgi:hypothetical protein